MGLRSGRMLIFCLLFPCGSSATMAFAAGRAITVESPDGRVKAALSGGDGGPRYEITVDGRQVLAPSRLGILSDGVDLGQQVTLGRPKLRRVNESWRFFGAHAIALNAAQEATVPVTSQGERYLADVHVANDGVGVRLRLPAKAGRRVQADRSTWILPGDPVMWADELTPAYESHYRTTSLKALSGGLLGLPLTARAGGLYVTMSEAAAKDYGDLAVRPGAEGELTGELYADPQGWATDEAVVQPWRVTIVARNLTDLVNSTLVQNLNPPADPQLARAEWIQPGRSTWQWLSSGAPKQEEQRQWIDWTRELGFEYYLVDEGWGSWKDPWGSLAAVAAYGKTQKVKVWLWVHSKQLNTREQRDDYFRRAVEAGIVGVKIDFPTESNRARSTWYYDVAREAAGFKLMVDFHGASKPTGMERTWPNVITREAVRGHEWHVTRYKRVLEPAHDTILPFTRYVAGPGDYTPTVFEAKELQGNTWAHELAQAVIFTSPFLCFGGSPRDHLENPARDVLSAIPPVWEETRALEGSEPGKVVAMARRSGDRWFLAVINGGEASHLELPLNFLGEGTWRSVQLSDGKDRPGSWERKETGVAATDHVSLTMGPRGGFVAWIRR